MWTHPDAFKTSYALVQKGHGANNVHVSQGLERSLPGWHGPPLSSGRPRHRAGRWPRGV